MMRTARHASRALGAALLAAAMVAGTGTGAGTAAAAAYPVIYSGAHGWQETGYARAIDLPGGGRARPVLRLQPWRFRMFSRILAAASSGTLTQRGGRYRVCVGAFGIRAHRGARYFAHLVVYVGSTATDYYHWDGRWLRGQ